MTKNKGLNCNVLRGEDKIGENLIEIEKAGVKVLLECGTPISPTESTAITEEYVRKEPYAAIIVSHFHEDHSGLLRAALAYYHSVGMLVKNLKRFAGMKRIAYLCRKQEKKTR